MVDMEGYRAPEPATGVDSATTTGHESWIHRPWVPWAAGAVAFTLTTLAGIVFFADAVWRNVEMQNLLERAAWTYTGGCCRGNARILDF